MDRNKFYRIREELHRHPELSGQEKHTIQYIRQVLQEFQPSRIHPLEKGHGLVAEYSFPGEGPTLLFRADIDAVAIAEKSPLPYCSENPGVAINADTTDTRPCYSCWPDSYMNIHWNEDAFYYSFNLPKKMDRAHN